MGSTTADLWTYLSCERRLSCGLQGCMHPASLIRLTGHHMCTIRLATKELSRGLQETLDPASLMRHQKLSQAELAQYSDMMSYRSRASFWPSRVVAHFQLGQATPACDSPCSCQSQLMRSVLSAADAAFGCSHFALVCCMLAACQGSNSTCAHR